MFVPQPWVRRHRLALRVCAGLILALVSAGNVSAHAELVASEPGDGTIVSGTLPVIVLTFSEPLRANSSIELVGPDGSVANAGPATDDPTSMRLAPPILAAGDYAVRWTAATDDGHIERGSVTFTVVEATTAPPPTASPTGTPPSTPTTAPSGDDPSPTTDRPPSQPTATPAPGPNGGEGGDAIVAIGGVALAIAGATLLLVRRGRRS